MKFNTKYDLNDKAYILHLKRWGKVIAFFINNDNIQYNIRYFVENKPETCYFDEDEISKDEAEVKLGFK